MKKLTFYKELLKLFEKPHNPGGFCNAITTLLLNQEGKEYRDTLILERAHFDEIWDKTSIIIFGGDSNYPELFKHRPEKTYTKGYWFDPDDRVSRINILNKIIEELISKGETE